MTDSKQPARVGRPKSQQKRQQIKLAASHLFLAHGFSGTSMDMIARESGVSKQTVYSHFPNKDALYLAVIEHKCNEYQLETTAACQLDLPTALRLIGDQFTRLLLDPQVIDMYRIVIGEARNNPHVAKLFYQAGPKHAIDLVSELLQHRLQGVDLEHTRRLAICFFNLLKGEFHMQVLMGLPPALSEAERNQLIDFVVSQMVILCEQALAQAE